PLREITTFDGFIEVLRSRAQILPLHLGSFCCRKAGHSAPWVKEVFDDHGFAIRIYHFIGVNAKAFHVPIRCRYPARTEQVRQHVHGFRALAHEIEDPVWLLPECNRVRLQGMDYIRKLDSVTD